MCDINTLRKPVWDGGQGKQGLYIGLLGPKRGCAWGSRLQVLAGQEDREGSDRGGLGVRD